MAGRPLVRVSHLRLAAGFLPTSSPLGFLATFAADFLATLFATGFAVASVLVETAVEGVVPFNAMWL